MPRTKVDALMDSVIAINKALANTKTPPINIRNVLRANVGHIQLCLKKSEYTSVLTSSQTSSLTAAVVAADVRIASINASLSALSGSN